MDQRLQTKPDQAEINFDDDDELEMGEYIENLEKINEDFLSFNNRIVVQSSRTIPNQVARSKTPNKQSVSQRNVHPQRT